MQAKPKYFELLSSEDQKEYFELQSYLSSKKCRNNRGFRLTKFSEMLQAIQRFCYKNQENSDIRCLVCGVCWLQKGIAINTRQLHLLIDKCKSSINGSLQRMGYLPIQSKNDKSDELVQKIPRLKSNFNDLREWTIRQLSVSTPTIEIYPKPIEPIPHSISYGQVSLSPQPEISGLCNNTNILNSNSDYNLYDNNSDIKQNLYDTNVEKSDQDDFYNDPFCLPPSCMFDNNDNDDYSNFLDWN